MIRFKDFVREDSDPVAQIRKIRDEINKNREDIKNIKAERDSLRKIIYQDVER